MLDVKFVVENVDAVKDNIKKKFQDEKLPLVDEVVTLYKEYRDKREKADNLRANRNKLSKKIGTLMAKGDKDEAEKVKQQVKAQDDDLLNMAKAEEELNEKITNIMMIIPNMIDKSVPIGKDDSENVEVQRFGEPRVPDFEVPYHTDIMESFDGIDMESSGRVSGNGFYYLMGDIEGEDLYLIGTSEHSMIGKFIDQIIPKEKLPLTLTSYSPCFRKEKGAHGIEERGVYRIHQFEKQEMIVVCEPEDSMKWYDVLWKNTVDYFRSLDIPVRQLECCSGDLADLKVKSCDVEAWSPRQKKYFEVGSCSNLSDAQARRLKIRIKGDKGNYFAHTLNNTCVAPPRMLIAFLENHLQKDGTLFIPEPLRPYMGGKDKLVPRYNCLTKGK